MDPKMDPFWGLQVARQIHWYSLSEDITAFVICIDVCQYLHPKMRVILGPTDGTYDPAHQIPVGHDGVGWCLGCTHMCKYDGTRYAQLVFSHLHDTHPHAGVFAHVIHICQYTVPSKYINIYASIHPSYHPEPPVNGPADIHHPTGPLIADICPVTSTLPVLPHCYNYHCIGYMDRLDYVSMLANELAYTLAAEDS